MHKIDVIAFAVLVVASCAVTASHAYWEVELVSASVTQSEANAGEHVEVCVTVKNNGSEPVAYIEVAILWGVTCDGEVWDRVWLPPEIAPGEEVTVCDDLEIPVGHPSMSVALSAMVDHFRDYPEPDESDNCIEEFGGIEIWATACDNPSVWPNPVVVEADFGWSGWDESRMLVRVRNDGANGARGHITFSFPQLTELVPIDAFEAIDVKSVSSSATIFSQRPGEVVYDAQCDPMTAQYLMIEAAWSEWESGAIKVFEIRIRRNLLNTAPWPDGLADCACGPWDGLKPCGEVLCQLDEFEVGYRASIECAATADPESCNWHEPATLLPTVQGGGYVDFDQQGRLAMFTDIVVNGLGASVSRSAMSWSTLKSSYR